MKIGKKVTVTYQYDSKGNKLEELRKVQRAAALRHQTQYCGNYIFENGVLRRILVEGGFIYFGENDTTYHYFLKDHLGSNRAVVNAKTGQVAEQYDYYPFGKQHGDYHTGYIHPYRYNGKELDGIAGVDWLYAELKRITDSLTSENPEDTPNELIVIDELDEPVNWEEREKIYDTVRYGGTIEEIIVTPQNEEKDENTNM